MGEQKYLKIVTYYHFIPIWKDNSRPHPDPYWGNFEFVGDNSIVFTKFNSIEDGLEAAKLDGTALREQNWEILKCKQKLFWTIKSRIMLKTLHSQGYLSSEIKRDSISEYYLPK